MKTAPFSAISEAVGDAWSAGTDTLQDLRQSAADRTSALAPDISRAADRLVPSRRARAAKRNRIRGFALVIGAVLLVGAIVALRLRGARKAADEDGSSVTPASDVEGRRALAGT